MGRKGFPVLVILLLSLIFGCRDGSITDSPPPAPEDLTLEPAGPHHVKLSWTNPLSSQLSLLIHRSDDGSDFVQIAEVNADSREFVDDSVSPDVTYVYQAYTKNLYRQSTATTSEAYRHPYLDACSSPPIAHDAPVDTFYDFPVSGLNYSTETHYSLTDSTGGFKWDRTSWIHFSLGYITLGYLKPGDKPGLMSIARNHGGDTKTTLNNLLRILIAIDEDGNTTNGIQIPCAVSLAYGEINPTAGYDAFSNQEAVYSLTLGATLPSPQYARSLYERYLFQDYTGHYELWWRVIIGGFLPIEAMIPFDIDEKGNVQNTGESILEASVDPHKDYRLELIDLAALLLAPLGYYQLEIDANIKPDQTIEGEAVIKGIYGNDAKGKAWGRRVD